MKFRYTEYETSKGTVYRPTLPITFQCGNTVIPVIDALVDTGADQMGLFTHERLGWRYQMIFGRRTGWNW